MSKPMVCAQEHGENWSLYNGDSVELIRGIPDDSIGHSVYSPPFASLYVYSSSDRDMGNCADQEEFFEHYKFLLGEMFRVTAPGRLMSVHCMALPSSICRDGYIGLRDFPGEIARAAGVAGWILHSKFSIWKDPVTAMQRTKALGLLHKQLKKDSCMSRQGIPDEMLVFRKPGVNANPVRWTNETFPVAMWQKWADPFWGDINQSDTLQGKSAREEQDEKHICPLQLEVIRRSIRLWSNPGDTVLTPFAGIGSEVLVAAEEGRRGVGFELKESYYRQAVQNLKNHNKQVCLF